MSDNNWDEYIPDDLVDEFDNAEPPLYEYDAPPLEDGEYYEDDGQYYEDDGGYYEEEVYPQDDGQIEAVYDDESDLEYIPQYRPLGRELRRGEIVMTGAELDEDEFEDGEIERRDYYPVRFRRDRKFGCLGGFMYAIFVISISLILACLAWMAASDVLALNKEPVVATIEIPKDIFTDKEVDIEDEDGKVIGTEIVKVADMDYVGNQLKDSGLIEYKFLFDLFAGFSKAEQKIDPGTYELSTDYDYRALIKKMQTGSESQVRTKVMFPEGYTMHMIFKKLEENDICSYDELMAAAADTNFEYTFLEDFPLGDSVRLEGYLFPDTYEFYQGMKPSTAINKLLATFHYKVTAEMYEQAEALNITFHEAIIVASLIEKEASNAEGERAKIASVIYNRLRAGMPLGIDATSLYSHPYHEGAPTSAMLEDTSDPYNTRRVPGLPPTPISNPGEASIVAALKPDTTPYYYYALNMETEAHEFFVTLAEHEAFTATQNYN